MAGHGCSSTGLSRGSSTFASRSPRACVYYISYDLMMDFDETRNFLRYVKLLQISLWLRSTSPCAVGRCVATLERETRTGIRKPTYLR